MRRRAFIASLASLAASRALGQAVVVSSCGGTTIQAGGLSYVTMDTGGGICGSGGGGTSSTWSAADATANGMTLSNGGLSVKASQFGNQLCRTTLSRTSGKYYIEFLCVTAPASDAQYGIGLADSTIGATAYLGGANYSIGGFFNTATPVASSGFLWIGALTTYVAVVNDVFQIAVDLTAGNIWIGRNGTWFAAGVPGTGTNPIANIVAPALGLALFPAISFTSDALNSGIWTLQSSAASQKYAPPAGFSPWDSGTLLASQSGVVASSCGSSTLTAGGLSNWVIDQNGVTCTNP